MLESVCKTDRNSAASRQIDRAQHARVMRKRHRSVAPAQYRQRSVDTVPVVATRVPLPLVAQSLHQWQCERRETAPTRKRCADRKAANTDEPEARVAAELDELLLLERRERPVRRGRRQSGAGGEIDETISFVVFREDLEKRDGAQRLHRPVVLAHELMDLAGALSLRTRVITARPWPRGTACVSVSGKRCLGGASAVPTAAGHTGETGRGPGRRGARARPTPRLRVRS